MMGRRKKKKGAMQKFLEKNQVFKSMKKPAPAPAAPAAPTAPRPTPAPKPVQQSGGFLRSLLRIQNAMGGGSRANAMGVGASLDRKLSQSPFGNALAPKPVPGLRREMDKVNRRRPQRYGAK